MCGTIHHNSVSEPGVIYKLGALVLLQKWKWTSRNEQFPRGRIEKAARTYAPDLSSITPDSREATKRERTAIDRCYPEPNGTKSRTKRERKKTHQLERFGKTDSAVNCSCSLPEYKKQLAGGADASQIIHPKPIAFSFPIVIEGMQCVTGDNKRYRLRVKRQLTPELNIHSG